MPKKTLPNFGNNYTKILVGFLMYLPKFSSKLNVAIFLATLPKFGKVENGIKVNKPL